MYDVELGKHFEWLEVTQSNTAEKLGINNSFPLDKKDELILNSHKLCSRVLDPIRERFGPVKVTSWYRSKKLNKKVGGSKKSDHLTASAADIKILHKDHFEACKWISENLQFKQMILEYYKKGDINHGWIHISFNAKKPDQKNQILTKNYGENYRLGLIV